MYATGVMGFVTRRFDFLVAPVIFVRRARGLGEED